MDRRDFFALAAASAVATPATSAQQPAPPTTPQLVTSWTQPLVIDRGLATGKPGKGKVFALITPHLDDGPFFASALVARLIDEGYTGTFIRTSNDEKDSYDLTLGETVLANERDTAKFLKAAGLTKHFDLSYRNHRMDDVSRVELRQRLIFLFRLLKVDTVISYDPWGHYEENPDHYVTAQAVEAACWMAADHLDFPEHFAAGLKPHSPSEKFYFSRGPQLVNRVIDATPYIEQKKAQLAACETMILNMVRSFNGSLAARKLQIPALAAADAASIREYVNVAGIARDRTTGKKYGLEYAEEFHYIGPSTPQEVQDYVQQHARPL